VLQLPKPYKGTGFFSPLAGFHSLFKEVIAPDLIHPSDTVDVTYQYNLHQNRDIAHCNYVNHGDSWWVYRPGGSVLRIPNPPNTHASDPINDSILIFNTRQGSYVHDLQTGRLLRSFLPDYWVNTTFPDAEGSIWVGTAGSGLFYFPAVSGVSVHQTLAGAPLQMTNFYAAAPGLAAGTSNGLFWSIDSSTHGLNSVIDTGRLPRNFFDPPLGNITRPIAREQVRLPPLRWLLPHVSSPKSIWSSGDTLIITTPSFAIEAIRGNDRIRTIWTERATSALKWNNKYYIGTLKGLYSFPEGGSLSSNAADAPMLLAGNIGAMAFTTNPQMLWVATSDKGVYCLGNDNKILRNFNTSGGLSDNICKCLFTDGRRVFVGTGKGLNIIDPQSGFSIDGYNTLDGLVSDDVSCVYASGNDVYVGTSEGYSYMNLAGAKPPKSFCRFAMTEITVSGRPLAMDTSTLTLSPEDNNISFRFSGISFRSMGRMKYTYRLSGLEERWQHTTLQYLSYPSLPAGSYVLEIYATNRYGVNSPMSSFPFTVRERWWRHWWVQALGVILLLGLVTFALWLRQERVRRREGEKAALRAQIADLEQMALRAQMNPHFIFNSMNSFYQYVIHKDLTGASKFMSDFSTLLRLMFEITAQKEITLDRELLFLRTYLEIEQTKLRDRFDYIIEVAEDLPPEEEILIPTFIIQPFVENSIRHGIAGLQMRRGHINISFSKSADELVVRVADNGVGRQESRAQKEAKLSIHQSRGMSLTGERISLYNKTKATNVRFEVEDRSPHGTLVIIHFPLHP
jgi:hypothetical protein